MLNQNKSKKEEKKESLKKQIKQKTNSTMINLNPNI